LTDPLIVSLVCNLVEEEGIDSIQSFPREGQKARFLSHLVQELLKREQDKRQRHTGLAQDFKEFHRVLQTVAFSTISRGIQKITPGQLQAFVYGAFENTAEKPPEAVDAFRTMAWIHASSDGDLAFRHEVLTLVCAAQYINQICESRNALDVADWQPQAPLADVVCQFAGETISSNGVLRAVEMLSGSVQFNVRQLIVSVLQAASDRDDFEGISEKQLSERTLASICRGIESEPSFAYLPVRILLKSLSEKRQIQISVILLWFFSKKELTAGTLKAALDLLHLRVSRDWNFCDDLRDLKENPTTSFDSRLLKDLGISARDLMDFTQYENIFQVIHANPNTDTLTRQYADRTLRGIEGEKHRLEQFGHSRGRENR
jgi:hypothetical protein